MIALRTLRRPGPALAAALVLLACSGGTGPRGQIQVPTRMVVQPQDFLGSVPCVAAPGAMRSYQVTLLDVTEDLPGPQSEPFALPTSSVVPCEVPVGFQFVVPGHRYVARVAAFDLDPSELSQPSPGYPAVVDASGRVVAPRWTTTCHGTPEALAAAQGVDLGAGGAGSAAQGGAGGAGGEGAMDVPRGALAVTNAQVPVRGCEPLVDGGESPTGLVVRLDSALIGLRCGTGPDEVASFSVEHESLPPGNFSAACGDAVVVTPLPAGQDVEVSVTAVAASSDSAGAGGAGGAGGAPNGVAPRRWVTRCTGRTLAGALVPASCEPLTPDASP